MTISNRAEVITSLYLNKTIRLAEVEGKVISAYDFLIENRAILSDFEQAELGKLKIKFSFYQNSITKPLVISDEGNIEANSVGSRSAILPDKSLYIKACRPVNNAALSFPHLDVDLWTGEVSEHSIPFGVLTLESVVRELFGGLLFSDRKWTLTRIPVCVFQYEHNNAYAIVFEINSAFKRIENFFTATKPTLNDMIAMSAARDLFEVDLTYGEIDLFAELQGQYIKKKSSLLAMTHANGIFRGFLNSNLGNDLISVMNNKIQVAITDFDTLKLINMNSIVLPDQKIAIIRSAIIEAAKSILPIIDCVWQAHNESSEFFYHRLEDIVLKKSVFLKTYEQQLLIQLGKLGWSNQVFENGRKAARQHPLFKQCIKDSIINSQSLLHEYPMKESLYRAQL